MEEEGWLMVNIESKISVEELKEFTHYYFDDYQHENFLMVMFCVPSEYPDYPETPWAQVIMDGQNFPTEDPMITVNVYGTLDEMEEQNLINLEPDFEGIKGKWYFNEPMLEGVYFLIENRDDTVMLIYDAANYHEDYRMEWGDPVIDNDWLNGAGPYRDYKLIPGPRENEYCIFPFTEPSYSINEKGELILLDRMKTANDTSRCVLRPLDF